MTIKQFFRGLSGMFDTFSTKTKIILFLLILIFIIYNAPSKITPPPQDSNAKTATASQSKTPPPPIKGDYAYDYSYEAKRACKDYVEVALKAPSTVKYVGSPIIQRIKGKKKTDIVYEVSGQLDAQNSYGAMIRSTFYCAVKRDPVKLDPFGNAYWLLTDIQFDQRL